MNYHTDTLGMSIATYSIFFFFSEIGFDLNEETTFLKLFVMPFYRWLGNYCKLSIHYS